MKARLTGILFLLCCMAASAQTGLWIYDRLTAQREAFPLERVYVQTDAEDYLQGDRIWLKAYLMDEVDHTPVDSTLYVYAELFDAHGDLSRRIKLLRRQGVFSGYLDIPEDFPSGNAYLRAYTRYMAAAPETAFVKRLAVGRGIVPDVAGPVTDGELTVRRQPHGFKLSHSSRDLQYLLVLRGGEVDFLGGVGKNRSTTIPDGILRDGPLDFLAVDRVGKVLSRQTYSLDRGEDRCPIPLNLDRTLYRAGDSVSFRVDPSALREGELLDLSVSVTCRPLILRHRPASITDYVLSRSLGFDYSSALNGTERAPGEKEVTATLSGTVRTELLGRPVTEARIGLISPDAGLLDMQWSDSDGRFRFEGLDYPSGTRFLVKSTDRKGRDRYRLDLDAETFPSFSVPRNPYATALDDTMQVIYADDDNPFGTVALEAAGVTLTVDGPPPTGFNRMADFTVTLRQMEERGYTTLYEVLQEIPGIFFRGGKPFIRADGSIYGNIPASIAVDGTIIVDADSYDFYQLPSGDFDLNIVQMPDIARVDVFKTGQTVLWGSRGGGGVISITTKTGDLDVELLDNGQTVHQNVVPLGYQRRSDFDSATGYRNKRTVYWNPLLLSDSVSFLLEDMPGTYLIVMEGITSDGRLVHEERSFDVYR